MAVPTEIPWRDGQPRLRHLVYDEDDIATNIDLVLVPGCGTTPADRWLLSHWRAILSTRAARARVLAFTYTLTVDDNFSWLHVLTEGEQLLNAIHERRVRLSEKERPLVFMAHSVGGMIVKQHGMYIHIPTAVLGLVFLGTPHSSALPEQLEAKVTGLLRALNSDMSRQALLKIAGESRLVIDLARRFEDVMLRADILSLFETKETKTHDSRFLHRPKKAIIVDRDTATVRGVHETLHGLDLDHFELPDIFNSTARNMQPVKEWLSRVLEHSQINMDARLIAYRESESPTTSSDQSALSQVTAADALTALSGQPTAPSDQHLGTGSANYGSTNFEYEMVSILKGFETSRRQAKLPCFMVDTFARNDAFFGRESELRQLDDRLLPPDAPMVSSMTGSMRYAAICGIPGLGKTELALEFVYSRRHKFDAIFWIRADEQDKLEFDFNRIAICLELDDPAELRNPIINRDLAKGWLANPKKLLDATHDTVGQAEAKWLVVFDNADNPDILNDLKPLFGNGSILVTSRDPNAKTAFSVEPMGIDPEPFSDAEGGRWLRSLVANGSEKQACEVSHTLGGLPLAITQMAAVIRKEYLQFPDFLEMYSREEEREEIHERQLGIPRETARGTIGSIWQTNDLSDPAKALLGTIAFLDPDNIREQMLSNVPKEFVESEDYPRRLSAFAAARGELIKAALVRRKEETKIIWIHRLLQDSVKAKMPVEQQLKSFQTAVALVHSLWPKVTLDNVHRTEKWDLCEDLYPHVIAFRRAFESRAVGGLVQPDFRLVKLFHLAGWWQHERGNSYGGKPFLRLALDLCEKTDAGTEGRLDLMCDINYALAAGANETNDPASCTKYSQKLLSLRLHDLQRGNEPTIRLAVAYNETGIGHLMDANLNAAEECFVKGIATYRSLSNFWGGMISLPQANLGLTYWLQNRLDEAYTILRESLDFREEYFRDTKDDSFRSGRILHGLGNVQFDRGLPAESETYHQRALQHYQSTIGPKHHRTADVCHKVAQHCMGRNDHVSARKLLNQALSAWKVNPSVYGPEIARSTFLLSRSFYATGDEAEAISNFKEAAHLRHHIPHASATPDQALTERDFDELVTFWSR